GYRKPTAWQEKHSFITTDDYVEWFSPIWNDVTGQQRSVHPAPFPLEIPRRLIRMFSFVSDTVLDPFAGTGTTGIAALQTGRNSISVELEPNYLQLIEARFDKHAQPLAQITVEKNISLPTVREWEQRASS
ncbi:MAG: site-specific DNA-methyltransferase, partial [Acidobacteriales bacterium]|nr:site-specific DNA-methyltransferase [Terriglobales bacterium]